MSATRTFTVHGVKCRSASQRRYVVFVCRPADFEGQRWDGAGYVPETYEAFAPRIVRRSDNLHTAIAASKKRGHIVGGWNVVVDTLTGEVVA